MEIRVRGVLTPHYLKDRGSSFNHKTCPLSTATQKVEARMSRSVHGYCYPPVSECPPVLCEVLGTLARETSDREVGMTPLLPEIIRLSLLIVLWLLRSCFYLKERFTLEPTNTIQLSKYYLSILFIRIKSGSSAYGQISTHRSLKAPTFLKIAQPEMEVC